MDMLPATVFLHLHLNPGNFDEINVRNLTKINILS